MLNYKPVNLDIPFFKEGINFDLLPKLFHCRISTTEYLSPELISFIEDSGLTIHLVEVFHRNPGNKCPIHTDSTGGDIGKLNYIFGGGDSKMVWYREIDGIEPDRLKTGIDTRYNTYTTEQVVPIDEASIIGIAIVQAGIPHCVTTVTERRLCVSVVLQKGKELATMDEVLTAFKKYTN